MPRLSVIVPVYNVEAYLSECIESILDQSLRDMEVILIDDGSPDGSGRICDEYAEKDGRVRVIHQKNQGVSKARNSGLKIAEGDYLGFVDPDDIIREEMFETMICAAEENDADIAICGFAYCTEDGVPIRREPVRQAVLSQRELILSIYGMPNPFHGSMCNKVFSRRIIGGLVFDEDVSVGEDWLLLYKCYERAEKAVSISDCFYTIRQRPGSATRRLTAQLYLKKLDAYERLYRYSLGKDKEIRKQATDKILDAYIANKEAIIREDYDRKSLKHLNRKLIRISVSSFLRGTLSFKHMVFHVSRGLQL